MRDSNPPLKHGENGTFDASPQFVDPVVDLDAPQTAELLAVWATLNANGQADLLAVARELSSRQ